MFTSAASVSRALPPGPSSFSDPIRTFPVSVKSPEDPGKPQISYVPWTKAEFEPQLEFLEVSEEPHGFAKEFNIVTQTYQPGFSDLYQLVHMLVGEGQAKHWINLPDGKILKGI